MSALILFYDNKDINNNNNNKFEQAIVLNFLYITSKFDRYCSLRSPV